MTPAELAEIGQTLYGPRWKSALARALGMSYVQVLKYARGRAEIPRTVELAVWWLRDDSKFRSLAGPK